MVDLNVSDLPQEKDVAHVSEVLTAISGHLTTFRAQMKQKVNV